MSGMDPALIAEAQVAMKQVEDRRTIICACGHGLGKHDEVRGLSVCNGRKSNCACREPIGVVKVPNARVFMSKDDEKGSAVLKGVARTYEMNLGHRIEWLVDLVCLEEGCGSESKVDFVPEEDGKTYTLKCEDHR